MTIEDLKTILSNKVAYLENTASVLRASGDLDRVIDTENELMETRNTLAELNAI